MPAVGTAGCLLLIIAFAFAESSRNFWKNCHEYCSVNSVLSRYCSGTVANSVFVEKLCRKWFDCFWWVEDAFAEWRLLLLSGGAVASQLIVFNNFADTLDKTCKTTNFVTVNALYFCQGSSVPCRVFSLRLCILPRVKLLPSKIRMGPESLENPQLLVVRRMMLN